MLTSQNASSRNVYALKILLFALFVIYFIFCFTPLRLHFDSIRYFAIKDCIQFGCPPDSVAAKDFFPFGYTALLLTLAKLGILNSFTLVIINCIFLMTGLYFLTRIFEKKISPVIVFIVVLLNWLIIKFVAHPLSEMQYIFFSLSSIYCFFRYTQLKKFKYLLLSLFLGWLAFQTRTAGISLIGALCIGVVWEFRKAQLVFIKKNKFLVGGIAIFLITIFLIFFKPSGLTYYLGFLSTNTTGASFFTRMGWRFTEWGEMFLNIPSGKFKGMLPGNFGDILFIVPGIIIFCFFFFVLFSRKANIPLFIKAYLIFYFIVIFSWPFADPRFWVPVIPLIAIVVLHTPVNTNKILKIFTNSFSVVYILMGIFSMGYMIYSSFNKEYFAKNQANGVYQKEYEMHFFNTPKKTGSFNGFSSSDTTNAIDPYVLEILKKYD